MDIEIIRITSANASVLALADPEVFDAAINPAQLSTFLGSDLHLLVIARTPALVVGQIRAMVHLQPDGPSQLYIDNLGVAPDFHRKGIARALVREAFLWGQNHDCTDAWVATETDNHAARALYATLKSAPEETMVYCPLNIMALG